MTLKLKTIVVLILSLLLSATMMSAQTIVETGRCGKNLTWTLDNGVLTISGTGKMYTFESSPWKNYHPDKVVINKGVTSIGDYAFKDCLDLTSVEIPDSVTNIGVSAFFGCKSLTSVIIPNSVTSIGEYAFSGCSGLNKIQVATDNKVYDSRNDCNAIIKTATNTLVTGCKSTKIPNSVTSIGECAFYGCNGLTSIVIPNSVTSIGDSAFTDCGDLTSVTIGNSVTNIGGWAFSGCSGLTKISVSAKIPPYCISNSVFVDVDRRNCELLVPRESLELYKSIKARGWRQFYNITSKPKKSSATKRK